MGYLKILILIALFVYTIQAAEVEEKKTEDAAVEKVADKELSPNNDKTEEQDLSDPLWRKRRRRPRCRVVWGICIRKRCRRHGYKLRCYRRRVRCKKLRCRRRHWDESADETENNLDEDVSNKDEQSEDEKEDEASDEEQSKDLSTNDESDEEDLSDPLWRKRRRRCRLVWAVCRRRRCKRYGRKWRCYSRRVRCLKLRCRRNWDGDEPSDDAENKDEDEEENDVEENEDNDQQDPLWKKRRRCRIVWRTCIRRVCRKRGYKLRCYRRRVKCRKLRCRRRRWDESADEEEKN